MALDSTKVRAAVSGAVSVGPTTATAPTGATGALTGFVDLGYVSDAGVTEARSRDTNDIRAWQGGALVRTLITSGTLTYNFVLLETKSETVELFYGTTVVESAADGSFVVVPTSTGGRQSFVIDVVDGAELIRTYLPQAEVSEVGDHVYVNSEAVGYEVTITAYPDPTIGASAKVWATALKSAA
jgi:hypothetical protein